VPLYFFDFTAESAFIPDPEGVELPATGDARALAWEIVGDLCRERLPTVEDWSAWTIEVADEGGQRLLAIPFSTVPFG